MRPAPETVFYDGHCGLCHAFVRFTLVLDRTGEKFRFAPLQGETFRSTFPENARAGLPDSVIVRTAGGNVLTRSTAALHVMKAPGGVWRALAAAGMILPAPLRDAAYDGIARLRRRLFPAPVGLCPVLPGPLRSRFLP